jgi:hypothetical protein
MTPQDIVGKGGWVSQIRPNELDEPAAVTHVDFSKKPFMAGFLS